jgi:hypothetical protein
LEKIYEMINDWTRDAEAKYQASLLSKEVESYRSASTESVKEPTSSRAGSKKDRSPSPNKKKGGSPTGKAKKGKIT